MIKKTARTQILPHTYQRLKKYAIGKLRRYRKNYNKYVIYAIRYRSR